MSDKQSLGQAIPQAIRFLSGVYEDVGRLVGALDEVLEKEGWRPTQGNRVSECLWNCLDPDCWLLPSLYRCYAPNARFSDGKKAKKTSRLVAIVVYLDPPSGYDEAVCLLMAVRFPKPKAHSEIWDSWDSGDPCGSDRLMESLLGKEGKQAIPDALLCKDLFTGAEKGIAFTLPLCDLVDRQSVQTKIVSPLLQEADKLRKQME